MDRQGVLECAKTIGRARTSRWKHVFILPMLHRYFTHPPFPPLMCVTAVSCAPQALRLNVGGKLLTNYLKEIVSYRQWNMMDEFEVGQGCLYETESA